MIRTTALVSDRFAAKDLRLRAARENRLGLQVYSVEQLAARLAGGFTQTLPADLLRERVQQVLAAQTGGELRTIGDLPGTAGAIASTLRRLWRADIDLAALGERHPRLAELARIEGAVLAGLPAGMLNPRQLAAKALTRVEHAPAVLGRLEIHGLTDLDPCWRPLLFALADSVTVTWLARAKLVPEWLEGTRISVVRVAAEAAATNVFSCASERHEAVEALRWARRLIAEGRARPEEIAIAAADPRPYDDILLALRNESNLPLAFASGVPALSTRSGQAAAALADILVNGISQARLRRLAALASHGPAFQRLPLGWQRVLPVGAALTQPQHWEQLLASLSASDWPDGKDHGADLREIIGLLQQGPRSAEEAGAAFLSGDELTLWQKALERAGASGLDRALSELRLSDERDPASSIAWLSASSLAATPRPFAWLLGLSASGWPRGTSEDPILPEHVLPAHELGLLPVRTVDALAHHAILAGTRRQVALSWPQRDPQGRPLSPSMLLAGHRPAERLRYDRTPDHAFSKADRWLANPAEFAGSEVAKAASACWRDWTSANLTAHDGQVRPRHPAVLAALERLHSASSLTLLLRNPLGFIWRYALKAHEPELDEDPLTLPPNEFGTLVHAVAELALAELERGGNGLAAASLSETRDAIAQAVARAAEAWQRTGGTPPARIWNRTLADVAELTEAALAFRPEPVAGSRSFAEVPFGGQPTKTERPAPWDLEQEVLIPGTPIRIGGYIDRLDLAGSKATVIDYKTGRTKNDDMLLDGGRELQRCIYAYAASTLLDGPRPVEPMLIYLRSAEVRPLPQTDEILGQLAHALATSYDLILHGHCLPGVDAAAERDELRFALPANAAGPYLRRKEEARIQIFGDAARIWEAP